MNSTVLETAPAQAEGESRWTTLRWVCLLASALPLALLCSMLWRYAVDLPVGDSWALLPVIDHFRAGRLSLYDLWQQHNEHRLIFPRLILVGLAELSSWNTNWEVAACVVTAVGVYLVLCGQLGRIAKALRLPQLCLLFPMVGVLVFSLNQWENWLWGWCIQNFLNLLAVVAGFGLLGAKETSWRKIAAAAGLGIVATYSFANGIMFWPIGLAALWLVIPPDHAPRWRFLGGWAVVSALVLGSYFYGYQPPSHHSNLRLILEHPLRYLDYVGIYLGAAVAPSSQRWAFYTGWLAILVTAAFFWRAADRKREKLTLFAPLLCLAAYAVLSAGISGVGRLSFGSMQAFSSRYITISNLLWIASLTLGFINFRMTGSKNTPGRTVRYLSLAWSVVLGLLLLRSSWDSRLAFVNRNRDLLGMRAELAAQVDGTAPPGAAPVLPEKELDTLRRHRLSILRAERP